MFSKFLYKTFIINILNSYLLLESDVKPTVEPLGFVYFCHSDR